MQELTFEQVEVVSGGFQGLETPGYSENGVIVANLIGAAAGGIGGFFGAIIAGGQTATGSDLIKGAVSGAVVGFIFPGSGLAGAVKTVGQGVVGGGVINTLDDVE